MVLAPVMPFLAACALPPSGVTQEDLAAYDEAVTSVGCTLATERHYLPVELQTGFTREQVQAINQYKIAIEEAVLLEGGGLKLVTGACA